MQRAVAVIICIGSVLPRTRVPKVAAHAPVHCSGAPLWMACRAEDN
jgi:hypothetical protein